MKLTKTEQRLMDALSGRTSTPVTGLQQMKAAEKLTQRGLAVFIPNGRVPASHERFVTAGALTVRSEG